MQKKDLVIRSLLSEAVFTKQEASDLFKARALDNESIVETDARLRFEEYCEKNCVSRRINL